jgi:hypothetical protein
MDPLLRKGNVGLLYTRLIIWWCDVSRRVGSYCKKVKAVLHQGIFYCKNYSINFAILLDPRFFEGGVGFGTFWFSCSQ